MATKDPSDPWDLARFVAAQEQCYAVALEELGRGKKVSHWMWYVFPQLLGLGTSPTSLKFALRGVEEARAYLNHPVLGGRLLECCRVLLSHKDKSALEIFGNPDEQKLKSSMTLFLMANEATTEFRNILDRYFGGRLDMYTCRLVRDLNPE